MNIQEIYLAHALPGRIRVKITSLKKNPSLADEIRKKLAHIKGTADIHINPTTGSILVSSDRNNPSSHDLGAQLANALGIPVSTLQPPSGNPDVKGGKIASYAPSQVAEGMNNVFGALNSGVSALTGGLGDLRVLVPAGLLLLGVRSLLITEKVPFPHWYDFLWFAFGSYFMLNRSPTSGKQEKHAGEGHET